MFQLWKLALLCGLLTGTSASLLGNFGNDPNVLDNLKPILDKGLETVDNTLETVDNTLKTADNSVQDDLQKLKLKIEGLQDSKAWQAIQEKYQETGKLLDKGLSGLISDIKSLGLKIGKSRILDLKAELTPDGQGLNLRFPTTANVNLALPLIGNIVNLNAALDILTGVSIDIDTQTGLPVVILGECTSDPDSVQVNLLNRHSALINRIANTLSSFLRKTVSFTVQKEVCLLIRFFLNTLGVNVIPNIINKLQDGIHLQI
ncbi:BPI fold-containing family A member 2 isoform X1 [Elephas maximus indicus]|uniref:BPI fold-containing family A member 2 isoform X1 n=1 Tax=Elephas maximus indicus TaxID=99487 RepID=UPI00211636F5|nr:BPI fold-containing family A member 2 isoform X1 [Elephas maximus indicus]